MLLGMHPGKGQPTSCSPAVGRFVQSALTEETGVTTRQIRRSVE